MAGARAGAPYQRQFRGGGGGGGGYHGGYAAVPILCLYMQHA